MKFVFFSFMGEMFCFIHVLMNALHYQSKGIEAKIVIEGSAAGLLTKLYETGNPSYLLFQKCLNLKLIEGVCRGCASQMGTLEFVINKQLPC